MSFGIPPNGGDWANYLKQRGQSGLLPKVNEVQCLHKSCSRCHGTGQSPDGGMCIHAISCPCKDCSWTA